MTVSTYLQIIRPQVRAALDDSVDVIVTSKGLPLRIYNPYTPSTFPYSYTDSSGQQHTVFADTYKRYSSLESELTRIDTFGTWKQMGDQTWWYPPEGSNPSANPPSPHCSPNAKTPVFLLPACDPPNTSTPSALITIP